MTSKEISIKKIGNFLEIDGKWYFPKRHSPKDDGKSIIFKEVDKKVLEENMKFLVEKLKPYIDGEMILKDALADMKPFELERLMKALNSGKQPKVKKKYGCVELCVNNVTIPIR